MSASKNISNLFSNDVITKKGSGIQIVFGVLLLIISIWVKLFTHMEVILYILLITGIILIISSFLIIINQYERAIILRLGILKSG